MIYQYVGRSMVSKNPRTKWRFYWESHLKMGGFSIATFEWGWRYTNMIMVHYRKKHIYCTDLKKIVCSSGFSYMKYMYSMIWVCIWLGWCIAYGSSGTGLVYGIKSVCIWCIMVYVISFMYVVYIVCVWCGILIVCPYCGFIWLLVGCRIMR